MFATASADDLASCPCDIGAHALPSRRRQVIARHHRGRALDLPRVIQEGDTRVRTRRALSTGRRLIRRPLHMAQAAELRRAEPPPVAVFDGLAERDARFEAMLARDRNGLHCGRVVGARLDAVVGRRRSRVRPRPEAKPQFERGPREAA